MRMMTCLGLATLLLASAAYTLTPLIADDHFSSHVDADGSISFPGEFRTSMVHLGSWFVPEGDASGFHDVYTERESAEAFRKNGFFPDGATLVKELRSSRSGTYTTGSNVSHATGEIKQWFVMIKDAKGRFTDNPIWGNGWGWALFKTDNREVNAATNYQSDCLGCHIPAREDDWVYTEAYPTLNAD